MEENDNISIECTKKQAFLIEMCLEAICRMCCGQLAHVGAIVESITGKEISYDDCKTIESLIKPIIYPELQLNASYGVGSKQIKDAQILYEMYKKLQNRRANDDNHHRFSVTYNEPLHHSSEPLITVTKVVNNSTN